MNSIFISSSFKDMQHERDAIRYKTLPRINEYLRNNYGQETTIIDLRWGINTNEADEFISMKKIVRTCLFEIDNCKPFMVALIGDRYGTIINRKLFEKHADDFDLEGVSDIGVTELEIRYAMHLAKQGKMHVFFYFRDMDYSTVSDSDKSTIYFDSDNRDDKKARLDKLKKDIKEQYPEQCRIYNTSFNGSQEAFVGLDALSDMIFEDIKSCVSVELGPPQKSPLCIDDAYIKSKQLSFVGRNDEMKQINSFIESNYYNIAILRGSAGTGKSAIMANVPKYLSGDDREFLTVFCGQSNFSDTSLGVMRNIVYRLRRALDISFDDTNIEEDWSVEQWHQEMDALCNTYIESKNTQLVILIDAIDQMIQDIYTKKMFFLPSLHSGKIKILLSAVTEYHIEKSLPLLEKMEMIKLKDPTQEEIQKAVDEIWVKYGKPSVANEIKTNLLRKPLANNYLYINLLLSRLTYIGLDVFGDENNDEQHIIRSINQIIKYFPNTLEEAAEELLYNVSGHINKNMGTLLFSFLRLSTHGLRMTDIESLCGNLFDASDFSYLKKLLGNFLFEREDHRYDFTHKIFRDKSDENFRGIIIKKYFEYASNLPADDILAIPFVIHSSICSKKYSYIFDMMKQWSKTKTLALKAAEYLAQLLEENVSLGNDLVKNCPISSFSKIHVGFISDYLMLFLSPSKTSKEFIDGISDIIFCDDFDFNSIDDEELKILCLLEKKHFDLISQYSGRSMIDTNRCISCLKELSSRVPTNENIIAFENFRIDYEPYWDALREAYIFSIDREDIEWALSSISKDITEKFQNASDIDGMLLCAKAYIKRADCKYPEIIAFRNESAEELISTAREIINDAAEKAIPLSRKDKIKCMLKIAECYLLIGKIYMRVTNEKGLEIEFFRHSIYEHASTFFEDARELFVTVGFNNLTPEVIENLLELLYCECELITKGSYLKNKTVKKINETVSELLEFVENNMHRIVQSQSICSQYADLCAAKANVISNKIPMLSHVSEQDLYPWSTIYTRTENYHLYDVIKEMDYWCDKSVYLCKYLFVINPTPGNIERLVFSAKSRIGILNYYEYRSLDTIKNAGIKKVGVMSELDASKEDIEKDREFQEKRKIPFLLIICEATRHPAAINMKRVSGYHLIAAAKLLRLYEQFPDDACWNMYSDELLAFEQGLIKCIEYVLDDKESFGYYLLMQHLRRFNFNAFRCYTDVEEYKAIIDKYNCILEDKEYMYNNTYSNLYYDWIL